MTKKDAIVRKIQIGDLPVDESCTGSRTKSEGESLINLLIMDVKVKVYSSNRQNIGLHFIKTTILFGIERIKLW